MNRCLLLLYIVQLNMLYICASYTVAQRQEDSAHVPPTRRDPRGDPPDPRTAQGDEALVVCVATPQVVSFCRMRRAGRGRTIGAQGSVRERTQGLFKALFYE